MVALAVPTGIHPLTAGEYPTVADLLKLPELAAGRPRVVAGAKGLQRPVRWVHVAEVPDIAPLLRGGELILTTGIALLSELAQRARAGGTELSVVTPPDSPARRILVLAGLDTLIGVVPDP